MSTFGIMFMVIVIIGLNFDENVICILNALHLILNIVI